jgi:DNA-binding MarR family transcriptional regulator
VSTEVELSPEELGGLLQELVNRVSHGQGKTLAVLDEASVTLQQVLLLRRLQHSGQSTSSELAAQLHISLPAMSQMVDRLI